MINSLSHCGPSRWEENMGFRKQGAEVHTAEEQVTGGWGKQHNEVHWFVSLLCAIIKVTKFREDETGGGMWHAWRKKRKFVQGLYGESWRKELTWKTWALMGRWSNGFQMQHAVYSSCWGQGQVVGCCEHGSVPSDSLKCGEFLA